MILLVSCANVTCRTSNQNKALNDYLTDINILKRQKILLYFARIEKCQEPMSSIYIWSKNFSHWAYEKSEAKMAAIDVFNNH
jgi:hypothetical protein